MRCVTIRNEGSKLWTTYLGSKDGGSSTHKRGSISRWRSEEGGYEEPLEALVSYCAEIAEVLVGGRRYECAGDEQKT